MNHRPLPPRPFFHRIALAAALVFSPGLFAERIVELYENGKRKLESTIDSQGRRHGRHVEYFESGSKRLECNYRRGKLHGKLTEYHENGKKKVERSYRDGRPSGGMIRYDEAGKPIQRMLFSKGKTYLFPGGRRTDPVEIFPRARDEIASGIENIEAEPFTGEPFLEKPSTRAPYAAGKLSDGYLDAALRHLNVYRYLCGLGHDVKLDDEYTRAAQHAAVICAAIGDLDHHPPQPEDMEKAFFDLAYLGASKSNLHSGFEGDLESSIDGFMNDSDASNIERVGHRAWCLNPRMGRTGLGEADGFFALWAMDERGKGDRPEFILYPAEGYFPGRYFGRDYAWSIAPSPAKYGIPARDELELRVCTLDEDFLEKESLKLRYLGIRSGDYGMGPAIVFLPEYPQDKLLEDLRILVSARWGKGPRKVGIEYVVEFYRLDAEEEPAEKAPDPGEGPADEGNGDGEERDGD